MLQVMIGIYSTCTVSGEPLCQTAQSFMPGLIQGVNPNMEKVRLNVHGLILIDSFVPIPIWISNATLYNDLQAKMLLKSLLLIGAVCGVTLGCFAICFPWVFPQVFTSDIAIINQVCKV